MTPNANIVGILFFNYNAGYVFFWDGCPAEVTYQQVHGFTLSDHWMPTFPNNNLKSVKKFAVISEYLRGISKLFGHNMEVVPRWF